MSAQQELGARPVGRAVAPAVVGDLLVGRRAQYQVHPGTGYQYHGDADDHHEPLVQRPEQRRYQGDDHDERDGDHHRGVGVGPLLKVLHAAAVLVGVPAALDARLFADEGVLRLARRDGVREPEQEALDVGRPGLLRDHLEGAHVLNAEPLRQQGRLLEEDGGFQEAHLARGPDDRVARKLRRRQHAHVGQVRQQVEAEDDIIGGYALDPLCRWDLGRHGVSQGLGSVDIPPQLSEL